MNILGEARSNEINSADTTGWTEIEVTVDSGACDTVMPKDECSHIDVVSSEKSRKGFHYEVADGNEIPKVGERQCVAMTENSNTAKRIDFQVAAVHKSLLSITKCADMGFDCVLGKLGGYLVDQVTGERIPIRRKGNLYVMRMWVKQASKMNEETSVDPDFHRRG